MSIRNMIKDQIPGSYYFSFFCHESGPCDDPSHHQSSPPPVFPDSLALTPHTCHSSHSQLFPVITDYLYHSLPPLCLVALYAYVLVFVVCTLGIQALCCRLYVSRFLYTSLIPVLFFALLAFLLFIKVFHLQLDPDLCFTVISLTALWNLCIEQFTDTILFTFSHDEAAHFWTYKM